MMGRWRWWGAPVRYPSSLPCFGEGETLVSETLVRGPGGELPLATAAVGAGSGLASGVGLFPAQGALSTAP